MGKEESHREPLIVACQSSMEDAGSLKALWNTDCTLSHNEKEYCLSFHMFNLLSRQAAWMSRDNLQVVECGPPRAFIFPVCQSSMIFFLKIDFRKEVGALTL
ncbi:hypothetical protein AVEN_6627-1 [Araneus ventricosus]|uniref:Uncharacterized protein n=1 Tax=Araneus ventricosus TaxID=182803 RepID=A0A4Y2S3H0_ARAVE|nr:hypothetical protein AVEN_6627-1 [Araneus ventricosus]